MSLRRHILCNSEMSDEYDHVEGIKEAIRLLLSRRNTENYHNATKQASIILNYQITIVRIIPQ